MNNFEDLIINLKKALESKAENIVKIRTILDKIKEKEIEYLNNNYNNFMKMKKQSGIDSDWNTRSEYEALIRKQQKMDSDFLNNKRDMRLLDPEINSLYKELVPHISSEYNDATVQINDFSYEFELNISSQQSLLTNEYIVFSNHILDYQEKLSYRKVISNNIFVVNLIPEDNNKELISKIEIHVIPNTYDSEFSIKIQMLPKIEINSIFNSQTGFMVNNKAGIIHAENQYLDTLKIQDLLTLDSIERNEISLIATDVPFKFDSDESYEVFKVGFSEFIQVLEKGVENNIKNKVNNKRVI